MTLLDTPLGREAVELATEAIERCWTEMAHRGVSVGELEQPSAEASLAAALPKLREALAEELRKEADSRHFFRPDSLKYGGWKDAARFIEEGK